jgi:hypothetical protein
MRTLLKEKAMSNGQFITLTAIGIANLAAGAFIAYQAKKAAEQLEEEVENVKAQSNQFKKNIAKAINDLEF